MKARNVLLKTDGRSGRGAVAKVADFGLAVRIDHGATHVSGFQVGLVRALLAVLGGLDSCVCVAVGSSIRSIPTANRPQPNAT